MHLSLRALLVVGLASAMSVAARALPVTPDFLAASLAVADRESVRDPYNTFTAMLNQAAVNAVPMGRQVAAFGNAMGSFGSALGGVFFGGGGGGFVPRNIPVITSPPASAGVYLSFTGARPQSNVIIGAVQVPDGGMTLVLLGTSLLGLLLVRSSCRVLAHVRR